MVLLRLAIVNMPRMHCDIKNTIVDVFTSLARPLLCSHSHTLTVNTAPNHNYASNPLVCRLHKNYAAMMAGLTSYCYYRIHALFMMWH